MLMMKSLRTMAVALTLVVCMTAQNAVAGPILFESDMGSGTNGEAVNGVHDPVAALANFYYDSVHPNVLIIDLFNTTPGGTTDSADVLLGLSFNATGVGSPTLTDGTFLTPSLTTQSGTSTILPNPPGTGDFTNSWKTASPVGMSLGQFGIATNGFGNAFNGNGLNNQDNGIVGLGTAMNLSSDGLSNKAPLAMNGLEFTLTFGSGTNFSTSTADLTGINFLFGTSGQGILPGGTPTLFNVNPVPEPATICSALSGAVMISGVVAYRRWKRRRTA